MADAIELRGYQGEAIAAARGRFVAGDRSTLVVLPTGAGKTVVFAEMVRRVVQRGGAALVLAHRAELLEQAIAKIRRSAPDLHAELEQGGHRASEGASIVVGSVPTLSRPDRLARFAPDAFRLIVVDEAHHATAATYRRILNHFAPAARVVGFTATPDRADGAALGEVFESVAFERSMLDLIRAGFLVPIEARTVRVEAFDLAGAKLTGGDLSEGDIARALGRPGVLNAAAATLVEHSRGRSTLVFVAGVERAHELAALLEGLGAPAVAVDGGMGDDARADAFARFESGAARFLVNVGVATEGTDLPVCSCVAVLRPTMSRALFVQMVGRGVRLHPGKADCLVLNFAPSNARHRLVAPVDVLLGADADEDTRAAAHELGEGGGRLDALVGQAEEAAPQRRRERALASYVATLEAWDPFSGLDAFLDLGAALEGDATGRVIPGARDAIVRLGVPAEVAAGCTEGLASAVLDALQRRREAGLCSLRIARQLARRGLNPNVSHEDGGEAMAALAAAGWRGVPAALRRDPRFAPPGASAADTEREADALLAQLRGAA